MLKNYKQISITASIFFIWLMIFLLLLFKTHSSTTEYTLKNGLKLVIRQDNRAPIVTSQIWYKVGSSYERPGLTGLSHMLEHMMFKGTKKYPGNSFAELIYGAGGQQLGMTSQDYTVYFQLIAKDFLELCFKLEADRMENLVLKNKDFLTERKVIAEERRYRIDNIPSHKLLESFMATAYMGSPYQHPSIGWPTDIQSYTLEDNQEWHDKYYAPNNATLVVVGDVEPKEVYKLAKKYFSHIKSKKITPIKPHKAIYNTGKKTVELNIPSKVPEIIIGFNAPSLNNADYEWEPYALEVLAKILGFGNSSRLKVALIKPQIASKIKVNYNHIKIHDGMFYINATPSSNISLAKLQQELLAQIKAIISTKITDDELSIAKTKVTSDAIYRKDNILQQGLEIGIAESINKSWQDVEVYLDKINSVTRKQIIKVAKKYLHENNMTIATLTTKQE